MDTDAAIHPRTPAQKILVHKFTAKIQRALTDRPNAKKILGNVAWLVFDRLFRMAIGLVVGLWVARYLGPEQFGELNYANAFVAMFSSLATLGLDSIVIRDLLRYPESRLNILGTTFALKFTGGLVTFACTTLAISLFKPGDLVAAQLVNILAVGTAIQATDTADFWFQSQVQAKYPVYARNIALLVAAAMQVAMISSHCTLSAFAWAKFAEICLTGLGLMISYQLSGGSVQSWRWKTHWARTLLYDSWPLILSGIVIMLYMRIDQVMLGQLSGVESVGLYSAAVRISELWYFIPMAIVNSVYPALLVARETNPQVYQERLQQLFELMASLGIVIALPMTFLSSPLTSLSYGEHFRGAGPILAIHIWTGPFVFLGVARGVWTTAEGLTRFSLGTTFVGAVVNIILNLIVIPKYGGVGAAIDTVVAQIIASVGAGFFFKQTRPIFYAQCKSLALSFLWRRKKAGCDE